MSANAPTWMCGQVRSGAWMAERQQLEQPGQTKNTEELDDGFKVDVGVAGVLARARMLDKRSCREKLSFRNASHVTSLSASRTCLDPRSRYRRLCLFGPSQCDVLGTTASRPMWYRIEALDGYHSIRWFRRDVRHMCLLKFRAPQRPRDRSAQELRHGVIRTAPPANSVL